MRLGKHLRLQHVEPDVQGGGRVRERADRDHVGARGGIAADRLQADRAGDLQQRPVGVPLADLYGTVILCETTGRSSVPYR